MGIQELVVRAITDLVPSKSAVSFLPSSVSSGYGGPQLYPSFARIYGASELIYACIELLATSVAEPVWVGHRMRRNSPGSREAINQARRRQALYGRKNRASNMAADAWLIFNQYMEETPSHPLIKILNNPQSQTPGGLTRGELWANVARDLLIAGDAFLYKARYTEGLLQGAVAELWRIRPDRLKPAVDDNGRLIGWIFTSGSTMSTLPLTDVIHFRKGQHPTNDHLGWGPVMVLAERSRQDIYQRNFLSAFYETGGTGPGAVLAVDGKMEQQAKDDIRDRNRRQFGPGNFLELLILDNAKSVTYTPLSLNRGLRDALPVEVNSIIETRIATVFNVPGSILGLLVAYANGAYASRKIDWQTLWDINVTPWLSDQDDVIDKELVSEYGGIDEACRDLSDIRALAEDTDALHDRARRNVDAGLWTIEEGRLTTGMPANPNDGEHVLLPTRSTLVPTPIEDISPENPAPLAMPAPAPAALINRAVEMLAVSISESRRVGRPRLEDDPEARADYEKALQFKAQYPNMTWAQIADRIGRSARQLREIRARFDEDDDE